MLEIMNKTTQVINLTDAFVTFFLNEQKLIEYHENVNVNVCPSKTEDVNRCYISQPWNAMILKTKRTFKRSTSLKQFEQKKTKAKKEYRLSLQTP